MAFLASEALALLRNAHRNDRLAHAYLITGPAGAGKREFAAQVCALILGVADSEALGHSDVHTIEPESKSRRIVTDQIRALEHELQMRSRRGGKKIGVIFDADRLQLNAANAFLKTLEEPPQNSHLLLASAVPDQLLETILSRCLEIPLRSAAKPALDPRQERLLAALRTFSKNPRPELPHILGLVREFQKLLAETRSEIEAETDAAFKAEEKHYKQTSDARNWLEEREDYYSALVEARAIAQRDSLIAILEEWWADVLRQQHGGAALDHPALAAETSALAARHTAAQILRKTAAIESLRENLGRTGVVEALALECAFLRAFE
jgi:DNA polymerase-3 subunit delta'